MQVLPNATPKDPDEYQMDLFDHLRELRRRLIIAAIAVTCGTCLAYLYATPIFSLLNAPFYTAFPNSPLIDTSPSGGLILKLKVSLYSGALLVSPLLFHQLWLFVTPGLYDSERKLLIPFVTCSTALFLGGATFCYKVVLPISLVFFRQEFESIGVVPTVKADENLSMMLTALIGFGAVFETPLLTFFLARAGIIDHHFLIRWIRHAVIAIFVISAILTPPDLLSQFLMAGPLFLLYCISIGIAWFVAPKDTSAELAEPPPE